MRPRRQSEPCTCGRIGARRTSWQAGCVSQPQIRQNVQASLSTSVSVIMWPSGCSHVFSICFQGGASLRGSVLAQRNGRVSAVMSTSALLPSQVKSITGGALLSSHVHGFLCVCLPVTNVCKRSAAPAALCTYPWHCVSHHAICFLRVIVSDQLVVIPLAPGKGVCHRDGAKSAWRDPPGEDLQGNLSLPPKN
ncbi:hypothetical protein JRQ81_002722 [Phrynocephalus forsythii]|uniref:Uncharacterized protein n=1 Tax=Phrynocephalus forsythii TaxID=171643 RepID=A0A9Q1AWR3_9SAUR|nr:hypothetical protein JRQ81_002722 [Phrynocephalus forsythii]